MIVSYTFQLSRQTGSLAKLLLAISRNGHRISRNKQNNQETYINVEIDLDIAQPLSDSDLDHLKTTVPAILDITGKTFPTKTASGAASKENPSAVEKNKKMMYRGQWIDTPTVSKSPTNISSKNEPLDKKVVLQDTTTKKQQHFYRGQPVDD